MINYRHNSPSINITKPLIQLNSQPTYEESSTSFPKSNDKKFNNLNYRSNNGQSNMSFYESPKKDQSI